MLCPITVSLSSLGSRACRTFMSTPQPQYLLTVALQGTLGPNLSQNDLNVGSALCLAFSSSNMTSYILKIFHGLDSLTERLLVLKLFKTVFNSVMFLASLIDDSMFFQPKSLHFMAEKA